MPIYVKKYNSPMVRRMIAAQQANTPKVRGSKYDKQVMDRKYEEVQKTFGAGAKIVDGAWQTLHYVPSFGGITDFYDILLYAPAGLSAIVDDQASGIMGATADRLGKKWEFDGKYSNAEKAATLAYITGAALDVPETVQVAKGIVNTPNEEYKLQMTAD